MKKNINSNPSALYFTKQNKIKSLLHSTEALTIISSWHTFGGLPRHNWQMFCIEENYFRNPVVLLTCFALHPPTRFLLSNSNELEISRLLRQMIARPLLQSTSSMMMVPLFSNQIRPLQGLRNGHLARWWVYICSQGGCSLVRQGDSKRITWRR